MSDHRLIVITGDRLIDTIGGEIEEMRGDSIVRERIGRLLARDCARRKLVSVLLPAADPDARQQLADMVEHWSDADVRSAAREVLIAAWGDDDPAISEDDPSASQSAR